MNVAGKIRHLVLGCCLLLAPVVWAASDAELTQLNQALADAKGQLASLQAEIKANKDKVAEAQKEADDAKAAKDAAQKNRDTVAAQKGPDAERKLKDIDYEIMMADQKLASATKTLERVQKKLDGSLADEKSLQAQIAKTEKSVTDMKSAAEAKPKAEAPKPDLSAQKAAEEKARKEAAAKLAAEQAAAEAAKRAADAEAAAKEEAQKKELGIDGSCIALPSAPTAPSAELSATDRQLQPFAQGELRRVNRLLEEKVEDDKPLSPAPVLVGNKLKPCTVAQKQALNFSYLGNGQYRLETPMLAGEQQFEVANIATLQRTIPDSDNGATYVFFLDVKFEGRYKLSCYKKTLFDQAPAQ